MVAGRAQPRSIAIVPVGLSLVASACSGSDIPDADTQAANAAAVTQPSEPSETSTSDATTSPEPIDTTTSVPAVTTTTVASSGDVSALMTSGELCELLPTIEIGALMNAESEVTTFGGGPGTICDVGIAWTGTSSHVIVELLNNGGDAGFDEGVDFESRIFNVDPIDLEGVGDRAADFGGIIIFSSGRSVLRIGGSPEEVVRPELEEIGRLIAAALG